ncbi:hypothetical protein PSP31120_03566 [Pandoraea sputorum]|nr:hypothetical protein PSP31120_03566 [Pandoraea sputorum]
MVCDLRNLSGLGPHQGEVGKYVFQRGFDVVQIGLELGHCGHLECAFLRQGFAPGGLGFSMWPGFKRVGLD